MRVTVRHSTPFAAALRAVCLAACAAAASLPVFAQSQGPATQLPSKGPLAAVGEVSLAVGQVQVTGADGKQRLLERGSPIRVGDRVETAAGGHVHLQFVDGGRMSVRPSSRLVVEEYAQASGAQGAIRFRLEEGVVRSITGQWGEAAKDRFRLNTPLAAIGVKGTDFAVRADGQRTAASVYTGAIVVAALDSACAATVGPCLNGSERLLTEAMKGQMLELSRSQSAPQFVPAVDLLALSTRAAPTINSMAAGAVNGAGSEGAALTPGSARASVDRPVSEAITSNVARGASAGPVVTELAWGRTVNPLQGDTLSKPAGELLAAGARPTVGTFTYTLFHAAPSVSPGAVVGAGESVVNFRLAASHVGLLDFSGQPLESLSVTGSQLSIDFIRSLYSTRLNLSGPTLGSESISASGSISSAGLFYSVIGSQVLAGQVTPSGKEVGYLFEKRVNPGIIRGITLWGR